VHPSLRIARALETAIEDPGGELSQSMIPQQLSWIDLLAVLLLQPVAVGLAQGGPVAVVVAVAGGQGQLARLHDPAGLAEQRRRVDRSGDRVQHRAVGEAEIAGDVAACLLAVGYLECADLLERRDEMVVEVLADLVVGQCVRTERFGVVSGELGILQVSREVNEEEQFSLPDRQPGGFGGTVHEGYLRAVVLEIRRQVVGKQPLRSRQHLRSR